MLFVSAGTAFYASGHALEGAKNPFIINGLPLDLALVALTDTILRISLWPAHTPAVAQKLNQDPALHIANHGHSLMNGSFPALPVTWGKRKVRINASPFTIGIDDDDGRPIQMFRIDDDGTVKFNGSNGPVFGLGEGGPQFDRRGSQYTMRNGQFAPQLATLGARLPIPWLISTDGWAVFFHQPFGHIRSNGDATSTTAIPTAAAAALSHFFSK